MIEDSQVKDKYFSVTLESEAMIKSFREDDFRLYVVNLKNRFKT